MSLKNSLWVEKYRPDTLDGYIGNDDIKEKIAKWLEEGDVPNLLLSGTAGTGKTTLGKIVAKNLDCDLMYLNASDENSVDTVREKIKGFAVTFGEKRWKLILLDECLKHDTLITVLRSGSIEKIPISQLNPSSDLIKTLDINSLEIEWQPFELKDQGTREIYEVELESGEIIECTENHHWYVKDTNDNLQVVTTSELHLYEHIISIL